MKISSQNQLGASRKLISLFLILLFTGCSKVKHQLSSFNYMNQTSNQSDRYPPSFSATISSKSFRKKGEWKTLYMEDVKLCSLAKVPNFTEQHIETIKIGSSNYNVWNGNVLIPTTCFQAAAIDENSKFYLLKKGSHGFTLYEIDKHPLFKITLCGPPILTDSISPIDSFIIEPTELNIQFAGTITSKLLQDEFKKFQINPAANTYAITFKKRRLNISFFHVLLEEHVHRAILENKSSSLLLHPYTEFKRILFLYSTPPSKSNNKGGRKNAYSKSKKNRKPHGGRNKRRNKRN